MTHKNHPGHQHGNYGVAVYERAATPGTCLDEAVLSAKGSVISITVVQWMGRRSILALLIGLARTVTV